MDNLDEFGLSELSENNLQEINGGVLDGLLDSVLDTVTGLLDSLLGGLLGGGILG